MHSIVQSKEGQWNVKYKGGGKGESDEQRQSVSYPVDTGPCSCSHFLPSDYLWVPGLLFFFPGIL